MIKGFLDGLLAGEVRSFVILGVVIAGFLIAGHVIKKIWERFGPALKILTAAALIFLVACWFYYPAQTEALVVEIIDGITRKVTAIVATLA